MVFWCYCLAEIHIPKHQRNSKHDIDPSCPGQFAEDWTCTTTFGSDGHCLEATWNGDDTGEVYRMSISTPKKTDAEEWECLAKKTKRDVWMMIYDIYIYRRSNVGNWTEINWTSWSGRSWSTTSASIFCWGLHWGWMGGTWICSLR